jgi:hypothetical protein
MTLSKAGAQFSDHALFPAQHLNLPHPKQFDPWSPRDQTKPRTRILLFSRDLGPSPAVSNAGMMRPEIVAAKSRVQLRPKFR